jgi:hypothetical protein
VGASQPGAHHLWWACDGVLTSCSRGVCVDRCWLGGARLVLRPPCFAPWSPSPARSCPPSWQHTQVSAPGRIRALDQHKPHRGPCLWFGLAQPAFWRFQRSGRLSPPFKPSESRDGPPLASRPWPGGRGGAAPRSSWPPPRPTSRPEASSTLRGAYETSGWRDRCLSY